MALVSALVLAIASSPYPVSAARKMTVEQLQQLIRSAQAEHRQDDEVAKQLADAKLTARLETSALQQLISASPGPRTSRALRYMADVAVFLDPPPNAILPLPQPSLAAQKVILKQTVHYVARTLPALPNFLATKVTQQLVDTRQSLHGMNSDLLGGMYLANNFNTPVAYRDGKETDDPFQESDKAESANPAVRQVDAGGSADSTPHGLTSQGEFGPMLGVILVDSAKGKVNWARWEEIGGKPAAVFQFAVPRSVSHFSLNFQGVSQEQRPGYAPGQVLGSRSGRPQLAGPLDDDSGNPEMKSVGYHGLFTVDPETGAILRIILEADWRPGDRIERPAMMVEYGPVKIGGATYICPIHSVATSVLEEEIQLTPSNPPMSFKTQHLNDVEFTEYRRFGSEATLAMVSSPSEVKRSQSAVLSLDPEANPTAGTEIASTSATVPETAASVETADATKSNEAQDESAAADPPPFQFGLGKPPAAVAESSTPTALTASSPDPASSGAPPVSTASAESDEEILIREVNGLPPMGASGDTAAPRGNAANSEEGSFTLQSSARLVDLDLVATDKHGRPITDLKQDEIELYDNGRKQQLIAFHRSAPGELSPAPSSTSADKTALGFTSVPGSAQPPDTQELLILLLDEAHLAGPDLNRARGQVLSFLNSRPPAFRVALYAVGPHGFKVIQDATQDHALVIAKFSSWTPSPHSASEIQASDQRNRPQIDTGQGISEPGSADSNQIANASPVGDSEIQQMGANPLRADLEGMTALARHFASVPGHKTLAWISGDSALVDPQGRDSSSDRGTKHLESALSHTREALNEAHIALYAVDASSQTAAAADASIQNHDNQLDPTSGANSDTHHNTTSILSRESSSQGADLQMTARTIQVPVRQLAEATGGRAINKSSDLKATLEGLYQDSSEVYELAFGPDTAPDGKFHTLQVKLPTRKDVRLRYRNSYLYTEAPPTLQERFQEALWCPKDAKAIPLTVQEIRTGDSANSKVRLRISLSGLSLRQKDTRWTDKLYVFVAQRDDAAQKAEISSETVRLSLKNATYESGMAAGIPYQRDVEAKADLSSVRILVVDGNSGKMGSVTLPSWALRH
jgi:VWFA-related protein